MRLWFARRGRVLIPTDQESEKFIRRLSPGECAEFQVTKPRSIQWHRMYYGICRAIGENQDPPRDESSIDLELRIRSGHFDVYQMDGHEVRVPKRIAFAEMDGKAWEELWPALEVAIREHFGNEYIREAQNGSA